jgi:hypothetical protein
MRAAFKILTVLMLAGAVFSSRDTFSEEKVPEPAGWVSDFADIIPQDY